MRFLITHFLLLLIDHSKIFIIFFAYIYTLRRFVQRNKRIRYSYINPSVYIYGECLEGTKHSITASNLHDKIIILGVNIKILVSQS